MRGYPQFSFWISITLVKIYIFYIIINRSKNTFELIGTVLNILGVAVCSTVKCGGVRSNHTWSSKFTVNIFLKV